VHGGESVEVYWARDSIDAHAVRALLEDAGIDARVENEMLQGAAGEIPAGPSTSPRVRVAGDDAERALALIKEWRAERDADAERVRPDWTCGQCGEDVEGDFDICWNCGGDEKLPARVVEPVEPVAAVESVAGAAPSRAEQWRGPARAMAVFIAWWGGALAGWLVLSVYDAFFLHTADGLVAGSYLMAGVGGLVAVYLATRACFGGTDVKRIPRELGWTGTTTRFALVSVLIGVLIGVAAFVFSVWVWPPDSIPPPTEFDELASSSGLGLFAWIAYLVFFAPVTEELLFRGAMLHGFMQRWGTATSVTLVTLIFTALHMSQAYLDVPGMFAIAGMGLLAAVLRLRSGSLVPAMLAHAAYNLAVGLAWVRW